MGIWKLRGGFMSRRFTMMQLIAATKFRLSSTAALLPPPPELAPLPPAIV